MVCLFLFSLDPEAFPLAVNVPETDIHICADALHTLHGETASKILNIGTAGRKTKTIAETQINQLSKYISLKQVSHQHTQIFQKIFSIPVVPIS